MITANKTILSIGSVGACIASYVAGLKLSGDNNYEEYLFDSELVQNITTSSSESFLVEHLDSSDDTVKTKLNESNIDADIVSSSAKDIDHEDSVLQHPVGGKYSSPNAELINFVEHNVMAGDSFISIARKSGVDADDLTNILYRSGISKSSFSLKKSQKIVFEFLGEKLKSFSIYGDSISYVKISMTKNGTYSKSRVKLPTKIETNSIEFDIKSNFSSDGARSGLTQEEITQVVDILKSKLDFNALKAGAVVEVIFDREVVNQRIVSTLLKAVRLKLSDTNIIEAYYYKTSSGAGYYDINGKSVTPSFLRHPVDNPLITSRFNLNRKHPILDVVRPHWGTDYGHMGGTPIKAISDATVKFAGTKGGFGKAVILTHPQGIETISAHMSKYGKGIKTGEKVKKGQVIGYVGKTGLSTGYHLHFELKKDGKRVDSLNVDLPTIDVVDDLSKFKQVVNDYLYSFRQ